MAIRIQKCWHGRVARRFFNAVKHEWIRNNMVTRIASVLRGHWTRISFQQRLSQFMRNPFPEASPPLVEEPKVVVGWRSVWKYLHYQRTRSICDPIDFSYSKIRDAILHLVFQLTMIA